MFLLWLCILNLHLIFGQSSFQLQGIIRDVKSYSPDSACHSTVVGPGHPDFNSFSGCGGVGTYNCDGSIQSLISSDRKPQWNSNFSSGVPGNPQLTLPVTNYFNNWFRTTPTLTEPYSNIQFLYNVTLQETSAGTYEYYNSLFLPIDGQGWGSQNVDANGVCRNFGFCFEVHGRFGYQKGQVFSFTGDDDVWAFINDNVAVNLGGLHTAQSGSVNLDTLGLIPGNNYRFDFFFCERHNVQSTFQMTTSVEVFCSYTDRCGICEGNGQECPCLANDNNSCTIDTCDPITGNFTFTPIVCNDNNLCTTDVCVNGNCTISPLVCNDNNSCTSNLCNPASGCYFPISVVCTNPSLCANNTCNTATGQCVAHDLTPLCNLGNLCMLYSCNPALGCISEPKLCNDNNACTLDSCNTLTGNCTFTPIANLSCTNCNAHQTNCTITNPCNPLLCNPAIAYNASNPTGQCEFYPVNCDDNNPCTFDNCTVQNGAPVCTHTALLCSQADLCNPQFCVNGNCTVHPVSCNDNNACTIDYCAVANSTVSCNTSPVICDDHNNCTIDSCNPSTGCVFNHSDAICNDNNKCTLDFCVPNPAAYSFNCTHTSITCNTTTACKQSSCDSQLGCLPEFNLICPGQTGCNVLNCELDSTVASGYKCVSGTSTSSFCGLTVAQEAAIISAGVLAAIIIAAVIAFLLAGVGAKVGYDYWKKTRGPIGQVEINPIYEEAANKGENPLFIEKADDE